MTNIKKVIKIKNLPPDIDPNYVTKHSQILETELTLLLNFEKIHISLEELYRIVENLHTCNQKQFLYTKLQMLLTADLAQKVSYIKTVNNEYLKVMNTIWTDFCKQIKVLRNIFLYFDRSSNNYKYNSVRNMSMELFKNEIILQPQIKNKLTFEILSHVYCERRGYYGGLEMLKSVIGMLNVLGVYDVVFHEEFLNISQIFYTYEANMLIKDDNISNYLRHVQNRIMEEEQRSKNYLNESTATEILNIVYKTFIKDHLGHVLDQGFDHLMDYNLRTELCQLYDLLDKISCGTKCLLDYFIQYILNKGFRIIGAPDNKHVIQDLLDFKSKLDSIGFKCFKNNEKFYEAIRNNFVKVVNSLQYKAAQLLAKYVDNKLKCKSIDDEELEAILLKVMLLFRYIQGKDIFEAFYKRDLARRLLLGKSTSQDAENSMIAKLKIECGSEYTSKIEGMFNDINVSKTINVAFKQHLNNLHYIGADFSINVLTSSFWPNYPAYNVNIPPDLANYQITFQKFYMATHSGRKLIWQPYLGQCVLKAIFDCGNKEFQVSLFQALILLLFNNIDVLSYSEIREATNLDPVELNRTLLSLSCGKAQILLKDPQNKSVGLADIFRYNSKYTDKLFRVRVNQVQLKESPEELKAAEKSIISDRQFQIDAAIVRIMKKKKSVSHNALLSELFETLDIPLKPYDLKKRIELLIEREYMERDNDNPANYTYIA